MFTKDARPKDTIRRIRVILKKAGFNIEVYSWKNPVPRVWSVSARERGCESLFANGKGMSRDSALAGALGEFMERINTAYAWSDYTFYELDIPQGFFFFPQEKWFSFSGRRLPAGILDKELRGFYDPEGNLAASDLVYRVSAGLRAGICAVPFRRVSDSREVYFPLNLLDNLYASNGMASGNTPAEARVQALSEILERYVKYKVIREGIALPPVSRRYYSACTGIPEAVEALRRRGFTVLIKDASLGGRYPVVNIVLGERGSKRCFLAFGAHPSFEAALSRTLAELLQGQELNDFCGLREPCRRLRDAADPLNLEEHFIDSGGLVHERCIRGKPDFSFRYTDFRGTRAKEYDYLLSIFKRERREVYIADFPGGGFYACRVLVPGLSEVYPLSDLILLNNNSGARAGRMLMTLPARGRRGPELLLREMDEKYIGDNTYVSRAAGVVFDEGSPWKGVCFGEVRLLALLALGRKEEAAKQALWCLESGKVNPSAAKVYKCLAFILKRGSGGKGVARLFPETVVEEARALSEGKKVFSRFFDGQERPLGTSAQEKLARCFLLARAMRRKNG